jgi:3-oxoacyl-[acyl-carrier-protein] synthase II
VKIFLTHYRTASTSHTELLDDVVYPQRVHWFPELFARVKSGMFYVPHLLANKVLDPELLKYLRENQTGKTAFILAAGNAHFAGINQRPAPENRLNYVYKFLPFSLTQVYAGRTAQACGDMDLVTADSSACASSLKVLMDVQNLIKHYDFDRVIVLSVEDAVSNTVLEFFGESKAVLSAKDEEDGTKPSAFDSKNEGFYVGQGAVFAVFESERARDKLKSIPHAQVISAYSASESSTNAIGQLETGDGFIKAIKGAMALANVLPEDIKIVKTHGTGTASNNKSEKTALEMFPKFVATSYKQKIGHTMGASGLLETCLLLDDMRNGFVPKIENRTEDDDVYLSENTTPPNGYILSLAAGMGNIYSAAILEAM